MLTPRIAALLTLLLASSSLGQRARRPPRPPSPISTIQPKANFDAQQFAGTWLLVAVASPCRHLQEQGHRAEATTLHAVPQGSAMTVSTFRKLDGICWAVRQLYGDTGRPGRFLLQARGARGPVDVVVGDTDYRGFAVLYLEQARQLSVKLYVRSLPVGDSFLSAFEQRVQGANLTEDHTLFFPKYGFCEAADQFHTLDEVRSFLGPSPVSLTAERTPKKKPVVRTPEKQRRKGRSSDGASAPPLPGLLVAGGTSSGPTSESLPPGPSCEAEEDVGQFQLPQARPPAL
ncbi:hypothetical protein R6Z07F_003624 [Ovis aries]